MKQDLNIKQKRVMIYFITAARKILETEGISSLTIRKVAISAGYNSATLYNYFDDMEELLVFASIGYLKNYIATLEKALSIPMNALQRYRRIYEVFSESCFKKPELFYGLFYGKYKKKLKTVINVYYDLFPDELGKHNGDVLNMLKQGEVQARDTAIMPSLVTEGFVKEENVHQTVILMTRMFQSYLEDACQDESEFSTDERMKQVMETFDYIMDKAGK